MLCTLDPKLRTVVKPASSLRRELSIPISRLSSCCDCSTASAPACVLTTRHEDPSREVVDYGMEIGACPVEQADEVVSMCHIS